MSTFVGLVSWFWLKDFQVSALFFALGIVIPQYFLAVQLYRAGKKRVELKIFSMFLFLNGTHSLDYPFLRPTTEGAFWGFSISLALLFLLSIFIPAFIVSEVTAQYSENLERTVDYRTKELQIVSNENKALVNLLCHDLVSPLAILDLSLEKLKKLGSDAKPEVVLPIQKRVQSSMKLMSETIDKVKELQRIRMNRVSIHLKPILLSNIVKEILQYYEDKIKEKNLSIELITNPKDHEIEILADAVLLRNQVLANLLTNAIKFTPNGKRIIIEIDQTQDNFTYLRFKDQGVGIPTEMMNSLFDFSKSVQRLGTNNEKGTGFGLALVKTCVDLMHGKIDIQSSTEVDHSGTTFIIALESAQDVNKIKAVA
jgi:signal transduction histidine kinase